MQKINFDKNGTPKGPFILCYNNGQIQTKSNYSGRGFFEIHGNFESYHKNGQLRLDVRYNDIRKRPIEIKNRI